MKVKCQNCQRERVERHLVPIYCLGVHQQQQSTTNLLAMRTSVTILLLICSVLPTSGRPGGGKCASDQDCPSSHPGRVGGGASASSYPASPSPSSPGFRVPKTTSASPLKPSYTLPLTEQELSLGSALQKVFLQSKPLQNCF